MSVNSKMYNFSIMKALSKEINWMKDSIKAILCTSDYVPDKINDVYKDVVNPKQVTGVGYRYNGIELANKTMTYDLANNRIILSANNVVWKNSTLTARCVVIYDDTPTVNKPLLGYLYFDSDQSSVEGDFIIEWSSDGIFNISTS